MRRAAVLGAALALVGLSVFGMDREASATAADRPALGPANPRTPLLFADPPTQLWDRRSPRSRWPVSFAWYQWFIESAGGGYTWFHTGERFEGPVHVNGDLKIDGDPWFGGPVTAGGGLTIQEGSDPTFEMGYWLHVEPVPLPTVEYVHATLKAAAQDFDGLYAGNLGNKTYYEVELGHPTPGDLTYTGYDEHGNVIAAAETRDISLLNGAAWFDETIQIWGELDGELTIGADGTVEIMDDIIYEGSTPGSGPDPDCDDVLGLIAAGHPQGDVIIKVTAANMSDVEIHAVMMALQKNIEAEDYQHGPPRGTFTNYGSLLADYSIHLGYYVDDILLSGYYRDYHHDSRMLETPPPFFPAREIDTSAPEAVAVSLAPCSPSPFRGSTTIRFTRPPGRHVSIGIYDVTGRLVKTVFEGALSGDSGEAGWDGTDGRGTRAASGVYFVRMEVGGEARTRKVVLLR